MNKRGFHCALFADSLLSLSPFFSLFLLHITQAPCAFFLLFLIPLQVSNPLSFAYLSLTNLSSTPLHYEDQLRIAPQKRRFILLDSLTPKILHYNLLIHLFEACFTPHENTHWISGEFCLICLPLLHKKVQSLLI